MNDPPSDVRKVRRGEWKRTLASVFMNRTVLVVVLRLVAGFVRLVRLLLGGE